IELCELFVAGKSSRIGAELTHQVKRAIVIVPDSIDPRERDLGFHRVSNNSKLSYLLSRKRELDGNSARSEAVDLDQKRVFSVTRPVTGHIVVDCVPG